MYEVFKIISFQISHRVFLGLSTSTIRSHKGSVLSFLKLFKWWTYTSELITIVGSNFLDEYIKYCGVAWWWNENHSFLLEAKVLKIFFIEISINSCLNRHIFKWNIEKGKMPHPGRGILIMKSPPQGPTRKQMPRGEMGTLGFDWPINPVFPLKA